MISIPKYKGFEQERQLGEYTIFLPDPPNLKTIANYHMVKENQMWRRPDIPKNYSILPKNDQLAIANREWERRLNGYWFFNNGNIEYMTGTNYFYCGHWKLDGIYPMFVDSDRDFWYLWAKAEADKNCTGLIYIADRREGKTFKATCILYDGLSTIEDGIGTIQSKTDKDAGIVFAKMINSWRNLPEFFKPTDEGSTLPKAALRFFEPGKRSSKDAKKIYEPALNSYIDFLPASEVSADGIKLIRYIGDEIGKTVRNNVADRNKVVKECLMDGATIVGKEILTTTVEEMESGGGKNCKEIWDGSNPNELDPLGRTKTGLMRHFKGADCGMKGVHPVTGIPFVDKYGYSNREMILDYIMAKRSVLEGEDLKSEKRKYPLNINEAFQSTNSSCVFNTEILYERREELLSKNPTRRVNFYRDLITERVKWRDAPDNGRWWISWDFSNEGHSNRYEIKKGQKSPSNTVNFSAGTDPFGHTVITGKGSKAASYVYRHYDPLDPDNSDKAVCRYYARVPLKAMMNDDLMLMCEYYGCKNLIENNFDDFLEHSIENNLINYIMLRPAITKAPGVKKPKVKEYGVPSKNGYGMVRHLKALVEQVENSGHKIDFIELIDDMLEFDPLDRTKSDDTVAYGLSLLAALADMVSKVKPTELKDVKFLKTFVIRTGLY